MVVAFGKPYIVRLDSNPNNDDGYYFMPFERPTPISVSDLNRRSKSLLENHFGEVCVEGEIGDLSTPASGHWYFNLKDSRAQIRCAMFRRANLSIKQRPQAGDKIICRGLLSIYEARGDYQLIVDHLEAAGDGALQRAFEELKQRLAKEGLFDDSKKQVIATHNEQIGVITSSTGAAIEDIASVLNRRSPMSQINLFPVAVQGAGAAEQIAAAIEQANVLHSSGALPLDVLIVGRGGGSLEDLWAFNEEVVARAIANSTVPVVSAVGHEIDFTIADLVADLRAATPSAAAELITRDQSEWMQQIDQQAGRLALLTTKRLELDGQKLETLRARLKHPQLKLVTMKTGFDGLTNRANHALRTKLSRLRQRVTGVEIALNRHSPARKLDIARQRTSALARQLPGMIASVCRRDTQRLQHLSNTVSNLGPPSTLKRGYAVVIDQAGNVIRKASQVKQGDDVTLALHKGQLEANVKVVRD